MTPIFDFIKPNTVQWPILISSPHSGTQFPPEMDGALHNGTKEDLDDTDWYIDKVYAFATALGIPLLTANYHRYVIDLNRSAENTPLYKDGRVITALCPKTDFNGNPIYQSGFEPSASTIEKRIDQFYTPYYSKIQEELNQLKAQFGCALLWDAHSIRSVVPGIRPTPFPPFILGSADGKAAPSILSNLVMPHLKSLSPSATLNTPFKGGNITRTFGKPEQNQYALQLEMTKLNYMDDTEKQFDKARTSHIQRSLRQIFTELGQFLTTPK